MKNYAYLIATLLCSCFILTACSDNTAIESEQIYALRESLSKEVGTTNDKEVSLNTKINQIEISKIGEAYLTDAEHTWSKSSIESEDNNRIALTLAPSSVTTYVLNLK